MRMNKTDFNRLMTQLRPKLYRFALAFVKRTDEAEDAVQEIGMKLWERHHELAALRSVEAYAMNAVKNRCLDYIRSSRNRMAELSEVTRETHEQTPDKSVEQADMIGFVRKMIERLPVQQQMVIRLRDIEGYESEEISEILEMSEGTVRTNLSRARQKIREELVKFYDK